jgi:hypothetical protein
MSGLKIQTLAADVEAIAEWVIAAELGEGTLKHDLLAADIRSKADRLNAIADSYDTTKDTQ